MDFDLTIKIWGTIHFKNKGTTFKLKVSINSSLIDDINSFPIYETVVPAIDVIFLLSVFQGCQACQTKSA